VKFKYIDTKLYAYSKQHLVFWRCSSVMLNFTRSYFQKWNSPWINTSASGWFWRFSQKKQQLSVALPTP